jgi:hypothetical protein
MSLTLKCPQCNGDWFRKEKVKAVLILNEPRPDRCVRHKEIAQTVQYSYTCNECGYELP